MTGKTVEIAIFWLPLIAGVLLGGLAGSAWYGGDKIPAIWIGFVGVICFLLTAAIQFQQYTYANLLQPEIELVQPAERTILTWNPPASFFINSRAEDKPEPERPFASSPIIVLQNRSNIIGQDASLEWEIPQFDVKSLVNASERLKAYDVTITAGSITVGPKQPLTAPTGLPMTYEKMFKQNVPPIAFLGKRVESWIPSGLWSQAMVYFIATLPEQIGGRSPPVVFTATVKWNIPEGAKPIRYKVTAVATNANTPGVETPKLTAYVSFTAEKLND